MPTDKREKISFIAITSLVLLAGNFVFSHLESTFSAGGSLARIVQCVENTEKRSVANEERVNAISAEFRVLQNSFTIMQKQIDKNQQQIESGIELQNVRYLEIIKKLD